MPNKLIHLIVTGISAIILISPLLMRNSYAIGLDLLQSSIVDIAKEKAVNEVVGNVVEQMVREELSKKGVTYTPYEFQHFVSTIKSRLGPNASFGDAMEVSFEISNMLIEMEEAKKAKQKEQREQALAAKTTKIYSPPPQQTTSYSSSSVPVTLQQLQLEINQLRSRVEELERMLEGAGEVIAESSPANDQEKQITQLMDMQITTPVSKPTSHKVVTPEQEPEKIYSSSEQAAIDAFNRM